MNKDTRYPKVTLTTIVTSPTQETVRDVNNVSQRKILYPCQNQ